MNKQIIATIYKDSRGFFSATGQPRMLTCGYQVLRKETIARVYRGDEYTSIKPGDATFHIDGTTLVDGSQHSFTIDTFVLKDNESGVSFWVDPAGLADIQESCNECCIS